MVDDMNPKNCAQKIIQQIDDAFAALKAILKTSTVKEEEIGNGITIRHLNDGSVLVCDQSDFRAPRWYERHTTEWYGEGETAETRLKETKGTVWVVFFSPSSFHVFETEPDAEDYCQEQLRLDNRNRLVPVRYVDGQRQTPRS